MQITKIERYIDVVPTKGRGKGKTIKQREVVWLYNGVEYRTRDSYGDRREYYDVLPETKAGYWSKSWIRAHPGPIQRGYALVGLAPDVPEHSR